MTVNFVDDLDHLVSRLRDCYGSTLTTNLHFVNTFTFGQKKQNTDLWMRIIAAYQINLDTSINTHLDFV